MYCIIGAREPREFSSPGIWEEGPRVYCVQAGELAAVVSESPIREYERARRYLLAHTLVLEEVMQEFTILPVRFGVVAPSAEAIREQVLARRHDELTGLLAEMHGRVELGIKALWEQEAVVREVMEKGPPHLRRLRDKIKEQSVAASYYDRMSLGEGLEAAVAEKREEDSRAILARLIPLAEEHKLNPLQVERMVVNAAFLVRRERQPQFDAAIEELDREIGSRLTFKYVGPVPPYNFVSLAITWEQ
jgi:hypothetical protein